MVNSDTDDAAPTPEPADRSVENLRERFLDLIADATLHAHRLEDVAESLGIGPELADGVGDTLYQAIAGQLELACKVLERSQLLADRILSMGSRGPRTHQLIVLDAPLGQQARHCLAIRNASGRGGSVQVTVADDDGSLKGRVTTLVGRPRVAAGQETSVEIRIDTTSLSTERAYAGTLKVSVVHEQEQVLVARRPFELWVRKP
jgi:hypothetical protein